MDLRDLPKTFFYTGKKNFIIYVKIKNIFNCFMFWAIKAKILKSPLRKFLDVSVKYFDIKYFRKI